VPIPILKINLDDGAFQRYLTAFHKYQRALEAQPDMWKGVNDSIVGVTIASGALATEIAHQVEQTRKLSQEEDKHDQIVKRSADRRRQSDREQEKRDEESAKRRRHAIDQVREYARSVTDATLSMGKWAVAGGAAGMVGGALSLWGLDRLMAGVGEERRLSSGLGVSMGQRQGMSLNMQRYFDVNSTLETVSNMQNNPGQWGTLRMMGINPQGKSPSELTYEAAISARRMFKEDKGNLALAQAQGLTNIFTADDLRRMASEKPDEFNKSIRDGRKFQGLSDDVGRKWQDFQITVDTTKLKIENALIKPLTLFEPILEKLVRGFGGMAERLFNDPGFLHGVDVFSKWLASPEFQIDLRDFANGVEYFAHKMLAVLRLLDLIPDSNPDSLRPGNGPGPAGVPSGNGVIASTPIGKLISTTANANYAAQALHNMGWSDANVKGLMANIDAESHFNPFAQGDMNKRTGQFTAYGIGQWHADRQADYAKFFGHSMKSVENRGQALKEQLEFMNFELRRGKFKKAGDDLRNSNWAFSSGYVVSKEYERPGNGRVEASVRGASAAMVTIHVKNQTGASVATTANSAARGG
jgi:hypothetical protein